MINLMEKYWLKPISLFIICGIIAACQPARIAPEAVVQTPALPTAAENQIGPTETASPLGNLDYGEPLLQISFTPENVFCAPEPEGSNFDLVCSETELVISQDDTRRKVAIFTARDVAISSASASISIETVSTAAPAEKTDQNNFGLFFGNGDGQEYALRVTGQFYNFEIWLQEESLKVISKTNPVYSPLINAAGQQNLFRLDCSSDGCDFFANGSLAGRYPAKIDGEIKTAGIFTASAWDQKFGQVKFSNPRIATLPDGQIDRQPFSLQDPLTSGDSTFYGTGLSGAFHDYQSDGFHFSPVIPYGYYAVKGGPALGDVSVSVTVKTDIDPGVSGSRFAGVVCRSSQEGTVMAIIRTDSTYTVFRDTPKQPLAVLAKRASDSIKPGLAENKLRLDCVGNQINFFINGTQVESLTDSRYGLHFGRAGLYTKAGGDPNSDAVIFRDFSISEVR